MISMIEFSHLTLLSDCISTVSFDALGWSPPRVSHDIWTRLRDLRDILHARAQRCRPSAGPDEAANSDCRLSRQVCALNFTEDGAESSDDPSGHYRHRSIPQRCLSDTAETSYDYRDLIGDSSSALNSCRDLYLRHHLTQANPMDPERERLAEHYQDFIARVRKYRPPWESLADLSTFYHFAKGLQGLLHDQNLILPRDWRSSFMNDTDEQSLSEDGRRMAIYIAIDFDLPTLLATLFQDDWWTQVSLNHWAWTPLHLASNLGRYKTACYLLDRGVDVDAATTSGGTPLHLACVSGHLDLVALLICKGANINAKSSRSTTPLHLVLHQKCNDQTKPPLLDAIARHLLEAGADPGLPDKDGRNALHLAVESKDLDLIELLTPIPSQMISLGGKDGKGFTPLCRAIKNNDPQVATFLIKHGHKVDVPNIHGRAPLHHVCRMLDTPDTREVIECLVEHGAPLNQKDENLNTPLHEAAKKGKVHAARKLLEMGASTSSLNRNGLTPSNLAVMCDNFAVRDVLEA